MERFSCDPSFSGQIPIAPREKYSLPAWSVNDSSTRSLVVHEGPGENIVADAIDSRPRVVDSTPPAPVVLVPTLSKYVTMVEVEISDSQCQAAGTVSDKSTGETFVSRKVYKVNYMSCNIKQKGKQLESWWRGEVISILDYPIW